MKRLCLSLALVAVATLLIVVPAFAAYYVYMVVESTADYTELALNLTLDIEGLVDSGYISSTGLDTRVTDSNYNVLPHMLAEDRLLWVSNLTDGNQQFIFWTGEDDAQSLPVITGYGGYVTVPDNPGLELGDVYAIAVTAYIDTSVGADKNIIRKDGAVVFNVTAANELTYSVVGGNSLVATNVTADVVAIMIYSDGLEMWMEIDDVEQDRTATSTVPNTGNDWILFENDACSYVYYFGMWVVEE